MIKEHFLSYIQTVRDTFDHIADSYEQHAALEREVCARLLEKTEFCRRPPERILDLGCGTGFAAVRLKQSFRKAQVIGMDTSTAMLNCLRRRSSLLRPLKAVCGEIGELPFASRSVDLLVSSLSSYWCPDPAAMFSEFRRVLRPDGMLLFSTFGPGMMKELKAAWASADTSVELPHFPDILEIGDALVAAGFREPVMDMEVITLSYPDLGALLRELEATGTSLLVRGWEKRHGAEGDLEHAYKAYLREGKYPLSFEIVYGAAFGPQEGQPVKTPSGDVATFSIDALRRGRKAT